MNTEKYTLHGLNSNNIANEYTFEEMKRGVGKYFCSNWDASGSLAGFSNAPCENIIGGNHDSYLVFGRDRNSSWASGHGGAGSIECGMIDLVAGRGQLIKANNRKENKSPKAGLELVDPMFHSDAARVYITQKAQDIDMYFGLKPSGGPTSINKSAVAAKADHVRLIGREKVRIYCGSGNFDGFEKGVGETNCLGERLQGQVIELQVGNQKLYPMVLGDKLVEYFKKKRTKEREMYEALITTNNHIMQLAVVVGSSIPGAAAATFAIFKEYLMQQDKLLKNSINTVIQDLNSIDNEFLVGKEHILSNSVYTT
jgi:hypothetical protein